MKKLVDAWADKNKVTVQLDFIPSVGSKINITMAAEAQARTGHDVYAFDQWTVHQYSDKLDPVDDVIHRLETVARESYEAGLAAVKPGVTFASVVQAMEKPIAAAGCWSKTPLLHTLTFGSTGFTPVNREQLAGTREEPIEGGARPGIRRGELVLQEGMGLELEPNACLGMVRVNIGAGVLVTSRGAEELNSLATRVQHVR